MTQSELAVELHRAKEWIRSVDHPLNESTELQILRLFVAWIEAQPVSLPGGTER